MPNERYVAPRGDPNMSGDGIVSDDTAGVIRRNYSHEPFGTALAIALRERDSNPWRTNLKEFAQEVQIPYSTMRSAAMGRTQPSREMLERVAAKLGLDPTYFREYRISLINEAIESHPELAGSIWDYVLGVLDLAKGSKESGK